MRTLLMLLLMFVAVAESKPRTNVVKYLLLEITESVIEIQNCTNAETQKILNHFVKDVFHPHGCTDKTMRQAAVVLKNTQLKHPKIRRQLFAYAEYTGQHNDSSSATEEYRLKDLLKQIKECAQKKYANVLKT